MRLVDDLPPAILAAINAEEGFRYHKGRARERDALLNMLPRRDQLVVTLAAEWAPRRIETHDLGVKGWIQTHPDLQDVAKLFDSDAWKGDVPEDALRRLEAAAMARHLASLPALNWKTLIEATTSLPGCAEHEVAEFLGDLAPRDASLAARLRSALQQVPTEPKAWIVSYARGEEGAAEHVATTWADDRAAGRMKADPDFMPSSDTGVSFLALLREIDAALFFDIIDRMSLAQIAKEILEGTWHTTSDLLATIIEAPVRPAPAVHAAFVLAVERALKRITEVRGAIASYSMFPEREADRALGAAAEESFPAWREGWLAQLVDALSARADRVRVLPHLVADALDQALRADAAERRQSEQVEDAWSVVVAFGGALDPPPVPLRHSEDLREVNGHLASWLLTVLLQPEGPMTKDEADRHWRLLVDIVPTLPAGLHWATGHGQVFQRAINGMTAGVLCDTTDPTESWLVAWHALAPARAIARRKDGAIHDLRVTHSWLLLVGGLATYYWVQRTHGAWFEGSRRLWEVVAKGAIEVATSLPYAHATALDEAGRALLHLVGKLPEPDWALAPFIRHAGSDPDESAQVARIALHVGVDPQVVTRVFTELAGIDVRACIQEVHDRPRQQDRAGWAHSLALLNAHAHRNSEN